MTVLAIKYRVLRTEDVDTLGVAEGRKFSVKELRRTPPNMY
jgi:hypothetical protein